MQTWLNHLVPQYFPYDLLKDAAFVGDQYSTLLEDVQNESNPPAPKDFKHARLSIYKNLPSTINEGPVPFVDADGESFFVEPRARGGARSPLSEIFPSAITEDGLNIDTCAGVIHVVGYLLFPAPESVPLLGSEEGPDVGDGGTYAGDGYGEGYGDITGVYGDN